MEKQAESLRSISNRYELEKKKWAEAISSLHEKVKVIDKEWWLKLVSLFFIPRITFKNIGTKFVLQLMKSEQSQLSFEAHECVDSIPEISNMVFAVQELGMLQLHYSIFIFLN